jgi:hypothetical protein
MTFVPQENSFEEDKNEDLIWGKIDLRIVGNDGLLAQEVIDMTWDIEELILWVIYNEQYLLEEEFDEADDVLDAYRNHHCIRYGGLIEIGYHR